MEGRYCYFFHTYLQFFFVCNIAHNHCDYLLFLIRNKNSTMKIISFLFLSSILNLFDKSFHVIEIVVIVFVIEHFSRQLSRLIFDDIINNLYVKKKVVSTSFPFVRFLRKINFFVLSIFYQFVYFRIYYFVRISYNCLFSYFYVFYY